MKHRLLFATPFVLATVGLVAAQGTSACTNLNDIGDGGIDASQDSGVDAGGDDAGIPPPPDDDSGSSVCPIKNGVTQAGQTDYIDFCQQKSIIATEHGLFTDAGIASSWNATTGKADTDGGVVAHAVQDDVAYGSSLTLYAISAQEYGDTDLTYDVVTPDLTALAPIVEAELTTLPASYDGELYMRLRRFAQGLSFINDTSDSAKIDTIADAYGQAIYATYFHPVGPAFTGDAGEDAGGEDGGADAGAVVTDGILGVPAAGGGIQYDVDQAASGALALVDMASRHEGDDAANAHLWAQAAAFTFNHLFARARHSSGLFYADLITSSDPGHDALASVVTPDDALLSETQMSVAASLLRANGVSGNSTTTIPELVGFPFTSLAASALGAMMGAAPSDGGPGFSLWDPTSTIDTTAACGTLTAGGDAAAECGGSGFFLRYLPSTPGLDNSAKTLRANALAFGAIYRSLLYQNAAEVDYEPLLALFESTQLPSSGVPASFLTQVFLQSAYPPAVQGDLTLIGTSFTVQADTYGIEALTEQWIGRQDCPTQFF